MPCKSFLPAIQRRCVNHSDSPCQPCEFFPSLTQIFLFSNADFLLPRQTDTEIVRPCHARHPLLSSISLVVIFSLFSSVRLFHFFLLCYFLSFYVYSIYLFIVIVSLVLFHFPFPCHFHFSFLSISSISLIFIISSLSPYVSSLAHHLQPFLGSQGWNFL